MSSPRTARDVYDCVYDTLLSLPPRIVLAQAEYNVDFVRQVRPNGTWDYVDVGTDIAYETILVGEIRPALCGTRFSAMGTHYIGSRTNPTLIDDKTRVKGLFVLGKPTDCTEDLAALFDNQLLTLRSIVEHDVEGLPTNKKNITIKEWMSRAESDTPGDPDYINVVTEPMYVVPKPGLHNVVHVQKKRALLHRAGQDKPVPTTLPSTTASDVPKKAGQLKERHTKSKMKPDTSVPDDDVMDVDPKEECSTALTVGSDSKAAIDNNIATRPSDKRSGSEATTNDVYHPSILYDHAGDLFKHEESMLRQLDFRDIDDKLIAPDNWYSDLRNGTFVMVRATLHTFNWENRRVYQLNAHTVKILDKSTLEVEIRKPIILQSTAPTASAASTSEAANAIMKATARLGKRAHDDSS